MSRLEDIFRKKYNEQHFESSDQDWESLESRLDERDKDTLPVQVNFDKGIKLLLSALALSGVIISVIWWFGFHNEPNSDNALALKEEGIYNPVVYEKLIETAPKSVQGSEINPDEIRAELPTKENITTSNSESNQSTDTETSSPTVNNYDGELKKNLTAQSGTSSSIGNTTDHSSTKKTAVESPGSDFATHSTGSIQSTMTILSTSDQENHSEDLRSRETETFTEKDPSIASEEQASTLVATNKQYSGTELAPATMDAEEMVTGNFAIQNPSVITADNKESGKLKIADNDLNMKSLLLTDLLMDTEKELESLRSPFDTNALESQFAFLIRVGIYGGPMSVDYLSSSDSISGKSELSYNAGVSVNLKSNAWSFETGLNYFQQKKINQLDIWSYTDQSYWNTNTINYSIITTQSNWTPRDTSIYYWNESTSKFDTIIITTMDYVTNNVDTVNVQRTDTLGYVNSTIANKRILSTPAIRYIEIPVLIGYELPINRMTLFLQTGIGIGILSGYSRPTANTETTNVPEMNKVVWSYLLKTGFMYHFTDHLSLSTTPHIRVNMSNTTKEKGSVEKYRNLGVNLGVVYSF